ncbi:caspase domain-containing protein [Ceratobasidium sp. AG-Ba]|nr:caspase domain-containing protein [Ceratobasidium sp. AG-Ba]
MVLLLSCPFREPHNLSTSNNLLPPPGEEDVQDVHSVSRGSLVLYTPTPRSVDQIQSDPSDLPRRFTNLVFGLGLSFVALIVGIGDENLPGPEHDTALLYKIFAKYHTIYSIKGRVTSQEIVRRNLSQAFHEAALKAAPVVLYFTGHGDDYNNFWLNESESLSTLMLLDWIHAIRHELSVTTPVYIAFDHCRSSLDLPRLPELKLDRVHIVWACSPQQDAQDVRLDGRTPYSQFLKGVVLTLHEFLSSTAHPTDTNTGERPFMFLEKLRYWTATVVRMHRGIVCDRARCNTSWAVCICNICGSGGLCPHRHSENDAKPVQAATGWFWEYKHDIDISGITPYVWRSACFIQQVDKDIQGNSCFRKHNKPKDPEVGNEPISMLEEHNATTSSTAATASPNRIVRVETFPTYQARNM